MKPDIFKKYQDIILQHSGISLKDGKDILLKGRLAGRIQQLGLRDEEAYLDHLAAEKSMDELTQMIDLVSTNVTSFMREPVHFNVTREALAEIWERGPREVRYWSAACSSGQEPYTLAMVALDVAKSLKIAPSNIKILATDISTAILERATRGIYTKRELTGVTEHWLRRYFEKTGQPDEYVVRPEVRKLVTFRRLNLSQSPYPMQGPFDAIFCRNVMIYFEEDVRRLIVSESERLLGGNGYLMIGHSENIPSMQSKLRLIEPTVYRKG